MRFYSPTPKNCRLHADNIEAVDYKDVVLLTRFISHHGKIDPSRKSGLCAKHQKMVATAIKRARELAILSYSNR